MAAYANIRRKRPMKKHQSGTSFSGGFTDGDKESVTQLFQVVTAYDKKLIDKLSKCKPDVQKIISRKMNQQQNKKIDKSILIWREFCDVTTFVGLRSIGGRKPAKRCFWTIWVILWISQLALCAWLSSNLFLRYLQYNIKTSTTYYSVNELPFPAITICNLNSFRKSIVGGNLPIMSYISSFYAGNTKEQQNLMNENNKTCYHSLDNSASLKILTAISAGFVESMRFMATDSYSDVLKCWWNSSQVDCNGIFLNHATDYSWCYTFNPDQAIAAGTKDKLTKAYVNSNGYGLDSEKYILRKLNNGGSHNGLRLLMNVNQNEYCGAVHKYNGAGFYVQVHDPAVSASLLTEKAIRLGPGYSYDVFTKPVTFRRHTEHLGKCVSQLPLSLYPNAKIYFQMACFTQSMIEFVWAICHCFPFTFKGEESLLAKTFHLQSVQDVRFCDSNGLMCLHNWIENNLNQNIEKNFPSCKVPCTETFYESQLSSKKFPSTNFEHDLLVQYTSGTNVSVEKNFLQVNFYFDSMNMMVVDESQAVSVITLAIAFGWTMSLFLGSSFLTPFEILYYSMYYIHEKVKKFHHHSRVIKIRKNVMQTYF